MNRPDALHWRNTNRLNTMEFTPGQLVYDRIPGWIGCLLAAQCVLGMFLWLGVRAALGEALVQGALGERWTALLNGGGGGTLAFIASQLLVLTALLLVAIPLLRRALRHHAGGLKDIFEAISSMANGVVPKPVAAGRPGEAGFLALAFNDMIARLLAQRKELVEANRALERRVEERTHELHKAVEKLESMARVDALTGLPNRRALLDEGDSKYHMSIRDDADMACLLIDLDNFKGVNDTLGHATGDKLLQVAADTLRRCCRPHDLPARLGGDEFVVLMTLDDIADAASVSQRLQSDFQTQSMNLLRGAKLKAMPSMSIGITSRKSAKTTSLEQLMGHADAALYRAKSEGKARTHIHLQGAA